MVAMQSPNGGATDGWLHVAVIGDGDVVAFRFNTGSKVNKCDVTGVV